MNLEKDTRVVMFRRLGNIRLSTDRAMNLYKVLESPNKPRSVEIDGNFYATDDFLAIVTPVRLEEIKRERLGDWKCQHGNWQKRDETKCRCMWGKQPPKTEMKEEDPEVSERGKLLRILMNDHGYSLKQLSAFHGKTAKDIQAAIDLLNE